jgi:hypothetical protein
MSSSLLSALSALAGAVIGGLMSLLASLIANRQQFRSQWLAHDKSRREDLYKEFIEEAAKCYVAALLHEKPDLASLIILYAKLSRMRVLSSRQVIESAEQLIKRIMDAGAAPAIALTDLQARYESLDIIRDFSESCRTEFDNLRTRQFDSPEPALNKAVPQRVLR